MSIIAAGTTTTTALSSTGNTDGTLQFQVNGTTPSVTLNTLGAIGVGSTPGYGTSGQVLTSAGSTAAPTWTSVTSSQWTTSSSNIYYNTGNVGIGTSSPAQALHVVSTGNQIKYPIRLQNDGTSGITLGTGQQFYVYNGTSVAINGTIIATGSTWSYGTYSANQLSISTAGSGGIRVASASAPITFHTGNADADLSSERARIDSSGNLLVGTTATAAAKVTIVSTTNPALTLPNIAEIATVSATAATGTINYDLTTQSVLYYTTNASGNFTMNVRGNSGLSLNSMLSTGQSVTMAFLCTNGSTAYYQSAMTIDGTSVTPKWQGGTAPTTGNASSIDIYVYTIIKTASATYTVLASQTKFA